MRKNAKPKVPGEAVFKYGVRVPQNVKEALQFDEENCNQAWRKAIRKELQALIDKGCFEIRPAGSHPGKDFQFIPLHLVFDVKPDGTEKARLVAGGNRVDATEYDTYASTVKQISFRLLDVIGHAEDLKGLCGHIGNAFINAFTKEKVYLVAGPEWGPTLGGATLIIRKALYGLRISAERWHAHFSDTLRAMGFITTRFDLDVWIKLRPDGTGYDYICTHVDDFKIIAKEPEIYIWEIQDKYLVKHVGEPKYYLGNDYTQNCHGYFIIGSDTYVKEALARIERDVTSNSVANSNIPMKDRDHPELDDSPLLDSNGVKKY